MANASRSNWPLTAVLLNSLYYRLKPHIPWRLRLALRRPLARQKRGIYRDVWPINELAARPPKGWTSWPDGKQFALVLTHDVEGPRGLERVCALMDLERRFGFKSSFNFIPEGPYHLPSELKSHLTANGFEVGVHDLHHDGQLYSSRETFRQKACRINHYLKEWNAVGFRSGFMYHKLDWLHDLNVQYDCSTFDTDPFEPQPDGVDTIFPFWVPNPGVQGGSVKPELGDGDSQSSAELDLRQSRNQDPKCTTPNFAQTGYVELPYTLPQDSTLFLLFRERSIDLWKKKLDWVVKHGGMVLLDTHPDYVSFNGAHRKSSEYSVSLYEQLLEYIRSTYGGTYWHALPHQVANLVRDAERKKRALDSELPPEIRCTTQKPKIWVDLDNTPHVPFFEPILQELSSRGFPLLVTARDAFQVCEIAEKKGLSFIKVGRHHGKNRVLKGAGLIYRALQLSALILREKPALGVSHGARSQLLLSTWLRIPTVLIEDYEYSQFPLMMRPNWVIAPEVIADDALCCKKDHIRKYIGIKEDVYVWKLRPDPALLGELGLGESDLIVTVRPPATEAHYHNPDSERLFERFMERACKTAGVRIVLLPRNRKQGDLIRRSWPAWFKSRKTVIPNAPLDGLNLMWSSDLVVSGGGTMNREAAALGVPVYSIFRGTIGAVDYQLSAEGRLVLVENIGDVDRKIRLEKRPRRPLAELTSKRTLNKIVDTIQEIAEASVRR